MPITEFQKKILILLKQHRNPNSYVAGGIAIHRATESLRKSNDIDFFHDTAEAVTNSFQADRKVLVEAGYEVKSLIEQPSFIRVTVHKNDEALKLEWVRDTAFRFFPVIEDPELGYRLHDVDLAVNKCLALANRSEVRDIIDLIELDKNQLSLTAACWAACGKDPGFTPAMLIDCMSRNSIIRPEQLEAELLVRKLSAPELKQQWMNLLKETESLIYKLPLADLGCVYTDKKGQVIKRPDPKKLSDKLRHFGTIGGSWLQVSDG